MLKRLARDKRSSLLGIFINSGSKKFELTCPFLVHWKVMGRLPSRIWQDTAEPNVIKHFYCMFSAQVPFSQHLFFSGTNKISPIRHGQDCLSKAIKQDGVEQSSTRSWFSRARLILKIMFRFCF
jgi:hypothetical protein